MFARSLSLAALACIVAAGGGYLVSAGAMPWPVPVVAVVVCLILAGITVGRDRRAAVLPRETILDDTEPAGVKPPPE